MPVTFQYNPVEKPKHNRNKPLRRHISNLSPKEDKRLKERSNGVQKLPHKRGKPSRKQRSELPAKEVKRLRERSEGICEKCRNSAAVNKAHLSRRWRSEGIPTAEDFADLCFGCHYECDNTADGRKWLTSFKEALMSEKRLRS